MHCPRCACDLNPALPHTQICPQCDGVWVDKGALAELLRQSPEQLRKSPLAPTMVADKDVPLENPIQCPVCSVQLTRYVYCAESGVTVDRCVHHGIWLDDGELAETVDFVQLGLGLVP